MSKLKLSSDLFIGVSELKRFQSFLREYTEKTTFYDTFTYGLYKNKITDPTFRNGKVETATINSIKIASIVAIDDKMQLISKDEVAFLEQIEPCACEIDYVQIPDDGNHHWVRVRYKNSNTEKGSVALSSVNNTLTGIGTSFTQTLRGGEDATSIRISESTLNPTDLRVSTVESDTLAILQGTVITEGDINDEATLKEFATVGRFTDGFNPDEDDQLIYSFDNYDVVFQVGTGTNGENEPTTTPLLDGTTEVYGKNSFFLASVFNTGSGLTITDRRESYFSHKGEYDVSYIEKDIFSITSVESCKFESDQTPQATNVVTVGWGLRSVGDVGYDFNTNSITLNSYLGGNVVDGTSIDNKNLDDWLVYFENGQKRTVTGSVVVGSAIKLTLDVLNLTDVTLAGTLQAPLENIRVVPNAEKISIVLKPVGKDITYDITANIQEAFATINVPIQGETDLSSYSGEYSLINNKTETQVIPLLDGSYFDENAYDENYALITPASTKDISGGVFEIIRNPNSYSAFKAEVITGDRFGFQYFSLSDTNPQVDLVVGTAYSKQFWYSVDTQTVDWYINLSTTGAVIGNKFDIQLEAQVTPPTDNTKFAIIQDGNPASIIYDMSPSVNGNGNWYYNRMSSKNLKFTVVFDGTTWVAFHESSVKPVGTPKITYTTPTTAIVPQPDINADGVTDLEVLFHTITIPTKQIYSGMVTAHSDWIFRGLTDCRWYLQHNDVTVDQFIVSTEDSFVSKGRGSLSFAGIDFKDGDTIKLLVTADSAEQCTIVESRISYNLVL